MASSTESSTRNNYTGLAIRTLENEEIEELVSGNDSDFSYMKWQKRYLQRRYHANEYPSSSDKEEQEEAQRIQERFNRFVQNWDMNDKPLLILDVDNTLIHVRYFSDEMEIGDLVTYFQTNSINNQDNAKVIELKETLTLQITNNKLMDKFGCEQKEHTFWIQENDHKAKYHKNGLFDYKDDDDTIECKILKILTTGCKIQMTSSPRDIIEIDFVAPNPHLQKLEPCLRRINMKTVDFIYEGFLIRIRPNVEDFFEEINDDFDIILYTSALQSVYEGILCRLHDIVKESIGRNDERRLKLWQHVLYRRDCILKQGSTGQLYYYKDLSLFGKDLSRIVMIDNSPIVLRGQEPNLIMIGDYNGDELDNQELYALVDLLHDVKDIEGDIRYYLCDIERPITTAYDISTETSCLNTSKQFIQVLTTHHIEHCATRQSVDRTDPELSVTSVGSMSHSRSVSGVSRISQYLHSKHKGKRNPLFLLSPVPLGTSFHYVTAPLCAADEMSPFERIDRALALYYHSFGKDRRYYDAKGNGKFHNFVHKQGFDEKEVDRELAGDDGVMYIEMDAMFPLYPSVEKGNRAVFNVIQYCYKYGAPPTEQQYHIHAAAASNKAIMKPKHRHTVSTGSSSSIKPSTRLVDICKKLIVRHTKKYCAVDELASKLPFGEEANYEIALLMIEDLIRRNEECFFEESEEEDEDYLDDKYYEESSFDHDEVAAIETTGSNTYFESHESNANMEEKLIKMIHKHDKISEAIEDMSNTLPAFTKHTCYNMIRDMMQHNEEMKWNICDDFNNESTKRRSHTSLTWSHVYNRIYQQTSPFVVSKLKSIVSSKSYDGAPPSMCVVSEILNVFNTQTSGTIPKTQQRYLKALMTKMVNKEDSKTKMVEKEEDFEENAYPGLTLSTLHDIFCVHSVFLFANHAYEEYTKHMFLSDIADNNVFGVEFIEKHALNDVDFCAHLDLHPTYLIDDNLMHVMTYHFAVSHYVHNLQQHHLAPRTIHCIVIPQRIVSVLDESDAFVAHNISDIGQYLSMKHIQYQMTALAPTEWNDRDTLLEIVGGMERLACRRRRNGNDSDTVMIVIDRRADVDVLYFFVACDASFELHELRSNYWIGFEYRVMKKEMIIAYLHYGMNKRLRFYGEHLVWFVPLLFHKRLLFANDAELLQLLYSHQYKHGMCCNLSNHTLFCGYYKVITRYDHVSVNYNRRVIGMMDDLKYELQEENIDDSSCTAGDIDSCTHIEYLLMQFLDDKRDPSSTSQHNVHKLVCSYDHLIRFHNANKCRQYFLDKTQIVRCEYGIDCAMLKRHTDNTRSNRNILCDTLNSLHCYLLHDTFYHRASSTIQLDVLLHCMKHDEFDCLQDEVLSLLQDEVVWNEVKNECIIKCRNMKTNHELLNVYDMMSLKLYSDYNIKKRHYWSSLYLYRAYLYAAKPVHLSNVYCHHTLQQTLSCSRYLAPLFVSACESQYNATSMNLHHNCKGIAVDWLSHDRVAEEKLLLLNEYIGGALQKRDSIGELLFALKTRSNDMQSELKREDLSIDAQWIAEVRRHPLFFVVLRRLVEEVQIHELANALIVWKTKFELVSVHEAFAYASYSINQSIAKQMEMNAPGLRAEFELHSYRIKKKGAAFEYTLSYGDELVMKENGVYDLYIDDHFQYSIDCQNHTFYNDLCGKFKLIHDDTILKLTHVASIPDQYHEEIATAKYLLKIESLNIYYEFESIQQINMILPFNPHHNKCDLYVRPDKNHQFVFLAKVEYLHRNTTGAKLNHLFCLLKYYRKKIRKPSKFLKKFGFTSIIQVEQELMPHLLRHKDMLYHMAKTKTKEANAAKKSTVLHRLVNDLGVIKLKSLLMMFDCKLKLKPTTKQQKYYTISGANKQKYQYKLHVVKNNKIVYFKYNEQISIKYKHFNIYAYADDHDQYVLIQKATTNKTKY
eukprot:30298_1